METDYRWWQRGAIYQIYPRSFMDGNADGIGDLRGIIDRLDYLVWLGVDILWLSPVYPSPMADFGYDVSDYTDIDPVFGDLGDFQRLLDAAHQRGMKLILDFVPNHTSDQHPWFRESRRSRDSAKRDWYLWGDPAPDGGPPNNWLSNFGGSAWTYDAATRQYFYHAYLDRQPDLNWRNPEVESAMLDVMRFWLDLGVDGFRVDVIWHLIKDDRLRDNPPNPDYQHGDWPYRQLVPAYTTDQPEVHELIARMRALLDHYGDRMMVGEVYLPVDRLVAYYGTGGRGAHLPFNFQLIELPWQAPVIRAAIDRYESLLPPYGWPNWVLGNHDKHRIASRIGTPQARVAAMLLLTLRGTPTLYYGDELGMHDVPIAPDRIRDPWEINLPGLGLGRDPARTPMQWDDRIHAGFSTVAPWLPVSPDYPQLNVRDQQQDPGSMLNLYRHLLRLRRKEPALSVGGYAPVEAGAETVAFIREHAGRRFLIALNFSARPQPLGHSIRGVVRASTHAAKYVSNQPPAPPCLAGDEGLVIQLEAGSMGGG